MAKAPPDIQRRIDAGVKAIHDDAATWMPKGKPRCPLCGERIEGLDWKAHIERTRISEDGAELHPCDPDRLISIPPGYWTAQPCGHSLEPEVALEVAAYFESQNRKR